MRVDIAWWDLGSSPQTIDSLREDLRDGAAAWAEVPGLRLKLWIADRARNRWGAVMLWDPERPADWPLPPNRAADLIGYPPTHRTGFNVEAAVEGTSIASAAPVSTVPRPGQGPDVSQPDQQPGECPCTRT